MATFLFYVEPFPIRNSLTHFSSILDHFSNSLLKNKTCHQFYIYSNEETLSILQNKNKTYQNHFLIPTKKENNFFKSFLGNWDDTGISTWQKLMNPSDISAEYTKLIKQIYHRQKFDYIVCWGTNFAVKQAAKELKIGFINMELGCSRAPFLDSLVADPWGVNGASVLSQAKINDFQNVKPSLSENDLLMSNHFNSMGYEDKFSYLNCPILFDCFNYKNEQKIAYIPLQLYDDANLLQYSPYQTVENVVKDILPQLSAHQYKCIIKEHPLSVTRPGAKNANLKARLYAMKYENVLWLTDKDKSIPNSFLFQLANVIITVNSSTGFEALYYDKPLVILGDAVYKIAGVFPNLKKYLNKGISAKYQTNIGKIRNFFLNYYLFSHEKANDSAFFFPYLKFIGDMSKENLTVEEIINRFIAYRSSEK